MSIQDLPVVFGSKPYSISDQSDLPAYVKKMPAKRRRQWIHIWNSEFSRHHDESRAFAAANGASGTKQANHSGVMLALFPPLATAKKIAIPGGEPAEDLHVTLLFFGAANNLSEGDLYRIQSSAQLAAAKYAPFTAEIGGIGRFYTTDEDGNQAFYGSVDSPTLPDLRYDLASGLKGMYKDNHGFSPHMTLSYVKDGDANPISGWTPTKVNFKEITLMVAGLETNYPFIGES